IGDVIDIGGTEVRYVAAEAASTAPQSQAPTSEAAAPPASGDDELDELLALESLNEEPAPPTPSGQAKIFAPPPESLPDDSNVPISLEDELKLPEPEHPQEPEMVEAAEPVVEPKPEVEAVREVDKAAE